MRQTDQLLSPLILQANVETADSETRLKTQVLHTLVALTAWSGSKAGSSRMKVTLADIPKVPCLSHETVFNSGLRIY